MKTTRLVTLRPNGQVTLPADVRATVHAETGDVFIAEVSDDAIILRPKKLIDASQAYFWTEEWQAGEREASAEIAKGQTKRFRSAEALIRDLHK
jgi:AbrB family looped-hinge helix DNA binding protein